MQQPRCLRVALLVLVALIGAAETARAQPRARFTFHVDVDPLFGDNTMASLHNPARPGTPPDIPSPIGPLGEHPWIENGQRKITGVLQHAPAPFRTLSSPGQDPNVVGATEYVGFRNAVTDAGIPGSGAGIWFQGRRLGTFIFPEEYYGKDIGTALSNCLFQANAVGIPVDSETTLFAQPPHMFAQHAPVIFNNTFAWNSIALWQGSTRDPEPTSPRPHQPVIANNLFDIAKPPGFLPGLSAFEGIDDQDREVIHRGTTVVIDPDTLRGLDFNALPLIHPSPPPGATSNSGFNNGATIGGWIQSAAVPASVPVPPRVDLSNLSTQPRTLFIADALRLAPGSVPPSHDLRLCPNVSATVAEWGRLSSGIVEGGVVGVEAVWRWSDR